MKPLVHATFLLLASLFAASPRSSWAEEPLRDRARAALLKAVAFYRDQVAAHGGYVYRYSADLEKREGEGKVDRDRVWVQPSGTPAVGLAYLDAYELTRLPELLDAAEAAGECLIQGQLRSGGWTDSIEFNPDRRRRFAYRVDSSRPRQFNWSTFDDDKTQAALRMMMRLDQALGFRDERVREATSFALESVLKAQFPNGGWPQGYEKPPRPEDFPVLPAKFPESWPRKYPGGDYWVYYTFNDNTVANTIETLLLAAEIYREPRYRDAAIRAGDFIRLAQMPEPQPAWAQQYDFAMQPVWARKFEPPAISGGESQRLLMTLMDLYIETGERRFLEPIPRALEYLKRSRLADGRLARFYELKANTPLYFTKAYELTEDDSDVPTHYGFKVESKLDAIERRHDRLKDLAPSDVAKLRADSGTPPRSPNGLEDRVVGIIAAMDSRGAWVEPGRLRYHGLEDPTTEIIASETFIRNLGILNRYLAAPAQ